MADPCDLLDRLPRELRDEIYELVFESAITEEQVDLHKASPPSKALIMTCKQAYAEANELYKATYRKYWRTGDFVFKASHSKYHNVDYSIAILPLDSRDVDSITRLTFESKDFETGLFYTLELLDRRGGWKSTNRIIYSGWVRSGYIWVRHTSEGRLVKGPSPGRKKMEDWIAMGTTFPSLTEQLHVLITFG